MKSRAQACTKLARYASGILHQRLCAWVLQESRKDATVWRRVLASIGTLGGAAASGASGAEASAMEPLSGQPRTWQRVAVQAASASGQAYRCNMLHRLD